MSPYQADVFWTCGHVTQVWFDDDDPASVGKLAQMGTQRCPSCDPADEPAYYVICGLGGYFYVIPASGLFHCRVEQIEDGPFSSAQDAHNRAGGLEAEFMLGETGGDDIHLGEVDYCYLCGAPVPECMCAAKFPGRKPEEASYCTDCGELLAECDCARALPW